MGGRRYYGVNSAVFEMSLNDAEPACEVTVKVVYNCEEVQTYDVTERFGSDFMITERLRHDNLVTGLTHFVGTASKGTLNDSWDVDPEFVKESTLFVVMEKMQGTLQTWVKQRRTARGSPPFVSEAEFLFVMHILSSAVLYMSQQRIVHRDFKPDNILVSWPICEEGKPLMDGTPVLVKVSDFGEALDCEAEDCDGFEMPFIRPEPSRGGSPMYLPPEVSNATTGSIRAPKYIDYTKSDVFALGMVGHFMLSGGTIDPFTTDDARTYSHASYNELSDAHGSALARHMEDARSCTGGAFFVTRSPRSCCGSMQVAAKWK